MKGTLCKGAAVLLLVITMSGCNLVQSPQTYMKPPKLSADKEQLKELISRSLPAGAEIVSPKQSKRTSAIATIDLDHDGEEEAIVFYKDPKDTTYIRGSIWTHKSGKWQEAAHIAGKGSGLDSLAFIDLTHDNRTEIVAGFSEEGNEDVHQLIVYSWNGVGTSKLFEAPFTHMVIDDLNEDGIPDVTLITVPRIEPEKVELMNQPVMLEMYQYDADGRFVKVDTLSLDLAINGYYTVVTGNVTNEKRGLVLDAGVGAHSAYTELIVYEDGHLRRKLSDEQTYKAYPAKSGDMNNDGILEIANLLEPAGWENEAMAFKPWIETFHHWDGAKGLTLVSERYSDYDTGFYVDFPKEWNDRVTIELSKEGGWVRFVTIKGRKPLLEIVYADTSEGLDKDDRFIVLQQTENKVFAMKKRDDSERYKQYFHLVAEALP